MKRAGAACFAAAALSAMVTACGAGDTNSTTSSPTAQTATARPSPQPTAAKDPFAEGRGVAFGVSMNTISSGSLGAFSRLAGARPRVVMGYQTWDDPLYYVSQMRAIAQIGALPIITWDPTIHGQGVPLDQIADGRYDSYLNSTAVAAKRWKGTIYIRFAHEMNLPGAAFGPGHFGDSAATFVAAWRHVVSVFRDDGVQNVEWVWSPNVDCNGHCPFSAFYPGDRWVDWVALDGYNYSSLDNEPWLTFTQVFDASYQTLARLSDRPMMVGETSSTEDGGSKATWISQIRGDLENTFPRVRMLVWFQRRKETDWRINSSPNSLRAFRALVRSPPFNSS